MQKKVYVIETTKHSAFGLRYDNQLRKLKLKRISHTTYPNPYGRIELLDPKGCIIESTEEKEDFFLITNVALPGDIAITENQVVELGTFRCLDTRTNEIDDKHVIALKDEITTFPNHKILTELDNIRAFLITLRGSFKVKQFTPGLNLPEVIKAFFEHVDWTNHSLWPTTFTDSIESGYNH